MKLLHHLAMLTLPIVVLARPGTRVEPPRVADFAIRDGLSHGHAHTGANGVYPRQVYNILEPREINFDHWVVLSKDLEHEADQLKNKESVLQEDIGPVQLQSLPPASRQQIESRIFYIRAWKKQLKERIRKHLKRLGDAGEDQQTKVGPYRKSLGEILEYLEKK